MYWIFIGLDLNRGFIVESHRQQQWKMVQRGLFVHAITVYTVAYLLLVHTHRFKSGEEK